LSECIKLRKLLRSWWSSIHLVSPQVCAFA
jgi:hypothetical protein